MWEGVNDRKKRRKGRWEKCSLSCEEEPFEEEPQPPAPPLLPPIRPTLTSIKVLTGTAALYN